MELIKYPSIEQFRNIVQRVKLTHDFKGKDENDESIFEHTSDYPILEFEGTIKLHGTNASLVKWKDGNISFQSRNNILNDNTDNSGFRSTMKTKNIDQLFEGIEFNNYIAIYGEWCGQGVQKGVAISELSKRFIIFGISVDGTWKRNTIKSIPSQSIYTIEDFKKYKISIDFNKPENVQNILNKYTQEVENECPVASFFGVEGTGEGIVFTCTTNPELKFKSKGEKHAVSKVTKNNSVSTELLKSVQKFTESCLTENRFLQGIDYLNEFAYPIKEKSTGIFIKWIIRDIKKEEKDTILNNNLNQKLIIKDISNKAMKWYFNYLDKINFK